MTIQVNHPYFSKSIDAILVDKLPSRLHIPGLKKTVEQLKKKDIPIHLNLKSDNITDIKLLIGSDQYYYFVYGHQEVDGVHLLKSKLGPMVSGPLQHQQGI